MVSSILLKNQRKKSRLYYYGTSSRIVFVRFLGELKTPKIHFEINRPLVEMLHIPMVGTLDLKKNIEAALENTGVIPTNWHPLMYITAVVINSLPK